MTDMARTGRGAQPSVPLQASAAEFELALVVVGHSFNQWVNRCAAAAGIHGLSTFDLLILHFLRIRGRELRASDIAFALSIDDAHLVTYALRKLLKLGQLNARKNGKETLYSASEEAEQQFQDYSAVRRDCLMPSLAAISDEQLSLKLLAEQLRTLAGLYEQAARSATLAP